MTNLGLLMWCCSFTRFSVVFLRLKIESVRYTLPFVWCFFSTYSRAACSSMQILFHDFDPFVYFCRVISISKVGYVTMIGDFCIKSASGLMPDSIFARRRESSILARRLGILGHHGVKQRCLGRQFRGV